MQLFEAAAPAIDADGQFLLDLDGYGGPIDLLLQLARDGKVDLSVLSIATLADQYIAFIDRRRGLKLEIAADYLVMAAWLAFLKSRSSFRTKNRRKNQAPRKWPPPWRCSCGASKPCDVPATCCNRVLSLAKPYWRGARRNPLPLPGSLSSRLICMTFWKPTARVGNGHPG